MINVTELVNRTSYLLEKQETMHKSCKAIWQDIIAFVANKINNTDDKKSLNSLEKINDLLSGLAEQLLHTTQEDITYLQEQVEGLKSIANIENPQKQKDVLEIFLGEDLDLYTNDLKESFESFCKKINDEAESSRDQLSFTLNDIKACIDEGSLEEAEQALESIVEELEAAEEEFSNEMNEPKKTVSCCGSGGCSSGGCSGCPVAQTGATLDKEAQAFSFFEEYSQELEKDFNDIDNLDDVHQKLSQD